ncbi:MAG: hypothetical protein LBR64_10455 [Dysgonamonadaceae bacterium]|jgi:hypothetical protein|nr:hypothetical protein [Dysgonamonadaceae bacterium]
MKTFFKVVLVFLIVFNFRMPMVYNSVFLAMLLATVYYIIPRQKIPLTYFTAKYNALILFSTLIMAFIYYVYAGFHGQSDIVMVKRFLVQFQMLLTMVYITPLLLDGEEESNAYNLACKYLAYAFAVQGVIHLTGYIYTPFGEWILSTKPPEVIARFNNAASGLQRFRGYALTGSLFFELPAAYGIAFIAFVRLMLSDAAKQIPRYMPYFVFFFLIVGIMLSGRTGFIGVGIGIAFYFIFVKDPVSIIYNMAKRTLVIIPVLLIVFFFVLTPQKRKGFIDDVFPFAFEFMYRFSETGELGTRSTDATIAFYFPLNDDTLIYGIGADPQRVSSGYPFTDAGYMRTLIYGGVPLLIMLFIYQYLYFHTPLVYARRERSWLDILLFLSMFFCISVYHIKDLALGTQHISEVQFLLLGFTYILSCETSEEKRLPA